MKMMFDKVTYNTKRYHRDPEFRRKYLESIKKYQHTKKGKRALKKSKDNLLRDNPDYFKDYMKQRRQEAVKKGMCRRCFKKEAVSGRSSCMQCLDFKRGEYYENR